MKSIDVDGHKVVFDDIFEREILSRNWFVSKIGNVFYVRSGQMYMHRIVMSAKRGQMIDHINGNGLDNRISNLRFTCYQANKANSHFGCYTSKYIGVSFISNENRKKKFRARAKINGKNAHLGYFETEIQAAKRYDEHAKTMYGSDAILNFS